MPPRSLIRTFLFLWWALGVSLLVLSVRTLLFAVQEGGPHAIHLVLLAGVEGAAALLFLLPPTLRIGAAGLLLTLAIAEMAHLHDAFRWDLLVYAAAVLFVAVHGPLTREQWRRALSASSLG